MTLLCSPQSKHIAGQQLFMQLHLFLGTVTCSRVCLLAEVAHALLAIVGKGSSSGVGFAIPIDTAKGLVEQILTYGKVSLTCCNWWESTMCQV